MSKETILDYVDSNESLDVDVVLSQLWHLSPEERFETVRELALKEGPKVKALIEEMGTHEEGDQLYEDLLATANRQEQ